MANLHKALSGNQQFQSLPLEEQQKVITRLEQQFAQLPREEQIKVEMKLGGASTRSSRHEGLGRQPGESPTEAAPGWLKMLTAGAGIASGIGAPVGGALLGGALGAGTGVASDLASGETPSIPGTLANTALGALLPGAAGIGKNVGQAGVKKVTGLLKSVQRTAALDKKASSLKVEASSLGKTKLAERLKKEANSLTQAARSEEKASESALLKRLFTRTIPGGLGTAGVAYTLWDLIRGNK